METNNELIKVLTDTINQLNETINRQNQIIEDLRRKIDVMDARFQPAAMTTLRFIDILENENGRTGKPKHTDIARHLLPYLKSDEVAKDSMVDETLIKNCIDIFKSNEKLSSTVRKLYIQRTAKIFQDYPTLYDIFEREMPKANKAQTINISLTQKELDQFAKIRTYTNLEYLVKSLFLIECYTSMRFSDIFRISDAMLGDNMITYIAKKTGKMSRIPVPNNIIKLIKEIRGNNRYSVESSMKNSMNEILPILGKRAKIEEDVIVRRGEKMMRGPKYEFIKTHTGRRTAITRWATLGIPAPEIQTMAGHSSITTTNRYICASVSEDTINQLSK